MKDKKAIILFGVLAFFLSGCDNVQVAPKVIEADGETFVACSGLVWADKTSGTFSSETVFKVSFTDPGKMNHTIWGVRKLSVRDPQEYEIAPMPNYIPDPKLELDIEGKAFVNGRIYTWPDGSKAELQGDKWKPIKITRACT